MMASSSRMLRSSSATRMRALAMAPRKPDGEHAALAGRRACLHQAPVILGDAVNEGETEAAALGLRGKERLEEVREVAGGDAVPGVGHDDLQPVLVRPRGHPQLSTAWHGLHGVETEVPQGLP